MRGGYKRWTTDELVYMASIRHWLKKGGFEAQQSGIGEEKKTDWCIWLASGSGGRKEDLKRSSPAWV
jgi:hypothetical protein